MKKQKAKPIILKTDLSFEEAVKGIFDIPLLKKKKPKAKKQEKKKE